MRVIQDIGTGGCLGTETWWLQPLGVKNSISNLFNPKPLISIQAGATAAQKKFSELHCFAMQSA
jgi:hypothetical protein